MRIPRAFQERHKLDVSSHYYAAGAVKGSRVYRAGGTCSCGERFGLRADRHNMTRADVLDAHRAHLVDAYEDSRFGVEVKP